MNRPFFILILTAMMCTICQAQPPQMDSLMESLKNHDQMRIVYNKMLADRGIIEIEDRIGEKLPVGKLKKNGGRYINTEYWINTPTLILGWGINHSQCMEAFPMLNRLYDNLGEDVNMIAISGDESSEVKSVLYSHSLKLTPIVEARSYLHEIGVVSMPKIIIVDRYGEVNFVLSQHSLKACRDNQNYKPCEAELKSRIAILK